MLCIFSHLQVIERYCICLIGTRGCTVIVKEVPKLITIFANAGLFTGSLVLVRFGNRPAWPALVEQDPNYNVHFAVDLESPCLNDPNDMNSNNENDNYETENCSQNTEKKNEKDKLMEEEENELNRKKMSDFIIDPIAYHVSLMGDPVMRIWIKKQYINAYSQKEVSQNSSDMCTQNSPSNVVNCPLA